MKKGDNFITVGLGVSVAHGDKVIELPIGSVFTYWEEDTYKNIWVKAIGRDCILQYNHRMHELVRQLPYPLEKPDTILGYRELINQIVTDMTEQFGVAVEVTANLFRTEFRIG